MVQKNWIIESLTPRKLWKSMDVEGKVALTKEDPFSLVQTFKILKNIHVGIRWKFSDDVMKLLSK